LDKSRIYRHQESTSDRFVVPGCGVVLGLIAAAAVNEALRGKTSSPLTFLPLAVVVIVGAWWLLTTPHNGDLAISAKQIRKTGTFGFTRTIDRAGVAGIVQATLIVSSRYGTTNVPHLLLIGPDRRCHLTLDNDYDVDALAADLGVPVKNAGAPVRAAELNRVYPGVTLSVKSYRLLLTAAVLAAAAVLVLMLVAKSAH
jgi:hypothetical protein